MSLEAWILALSLAAALILLAALVLTRRRASFGHHSRPACPPPSPGPLDANLRLENGEVADLVRAALAPGLRGQVDRKPRLVLWQDGGSEALLHLDSVDAMLAEGALVVSANLETDQTGIAPLIVTFALAPPGDEAGLVAVSDALARGHPQLASRWGATFRETVWAALLARARDVAQARSLVPTGLHIVDGTLSFAAEPAASLQTAVAPERLAKASRSR